MADFQPASVDILGYDEPKLRGLCQDLGLPAYKGGVLFKWLQQGAAYEDMTSLSKKERSLLAETHPLRLPQVRRELVSCDGSCAKLLLDFDAKVQVELVIMLYERKTSRSRATLCLSTQAGCAMGCAFCATGLSGLMRNLTAGEIVAQAVVGDRWLRRRELGGVTNLVFMGMGEPFANFDALVESLRVLNSSEGLSVGQRRMTVSTCGLAPQIREFADLQTEVGLAVSLHAPTDELRSELMPVNRRWPVSELMAACDYYVAKTRRRVSYEYALLRDVNDRPQDAGALAELLSGRLAHVNLIPVNFVEETGFLPSRAETLKEFCDVLTSRGLEATVRERRGADIDGACGQLRRREARERQ